MGGLIHTLCMITAIGCAVLLLKSYFCTKYRLLLWSGLCFVGLSLNNFFLVLDRNVFSSIDFSTARLVSALIGLTLLLYGLIWEAE